MGIKSINLEKAESISKTLSSNTDDKPNCATTISLFSKEKPTKSENSDITKLESKIAMMREKLENINALLLKDSFSREDQATYLEVTTPEFLKYLQTDALAICIVSTNVLFYGVLINSILKSAGLRKIVKSGAPVLLASSLVTMGWNIYYNIKLGNIGGRINTEGTSQKDIDSALKIFREDNIKRLKDNLKVEYEKTLEKMNQLITQRSELLKEHPEDN